MIYALLAVLIIDIICLGINVFMILKDYENFYAKRKLKCNLIIILQIVAIIAALFACIDKIPLLN